MTENAQPNPSRDINDTVMDLLNNLLPTKVSDTSSEQESDKHIVYEVANQIAFPQRLIAGTQLADFWYGVFVGGGDQFREFSSHVIGTLSDAKHQIKYTHLSFRVAALRGKARRFHVVQRGMAKAVLYMAHLGDANHLYASVRLLYRGYVDQFKAALLLVATFLIAIIPAAFLFLPMWILLGVTKEVEVSNSILRDSETIINEGTAVLAFGLSLLLSMGGLLAVFGAWNLWFYGDVLALIREDLDELYRDDFVALATEIRLAIELARDALDLTALDTDTGSPKRSLGFALPTNLTKRQPRL